MQLVTAILIKLLRGLLVVAMLMAVLFGGYLALAYVWPTVRQFYQAPAELERIQASLEENQAKLAAREAEAREHRGLIERIQGQLEEQEEALERDILRNVEDLRTAAAEQQKRMHASLEESRRNRAQALWAVEHEYCSTWNPIKWLTCRQVRENIAAFEENVALQRRALTTAIERLDENAKREAERLRTESLREFDERTTDMRKELADSIEHFERAELERQGLLAQLEDLQDEERHLQAQHWIVMELQQRWPGLLLVALLIFFSPYLRRTLWYFIGMPIVSGAAPIEITPAQTPGTVEAGSSGRTIEVTLSSPQVGAQAGASAILCRPGYIQSDKVGARSEVFYDWRAPNLSYVSGLVMLTRIQAESDKWDETSERVVTLGSNDDPDAYLLELRLTNHPGVALRARNVVAITEGLTVSSRWRLFSWHAWATSQVRFLLFSGTGSVIIEGFGDVGAQPVAKSVDGRACEKRMPQVIGFDTRLSYKTRRTATFLPYLVNPESEPLVVDVFEGDGVFFHQKNQSSTKHRSAGEQVTGLFFDAIKRLLGL